MSSKVITFIIGSIGLLLALWLGVSVADQQWIRMSIFVLIALGVIFVSGGYKYSYHILLCFILLDGMFNLGFAIKATEQLLVVTCALVAATFWRTEDTLPRPYELRHWSFTFVKVFLGVWILYVFFHMSLHLLLFETVGLKNILKSYNATFTPYVFLLFFFMRPQMFPIPRNYLPIFALILFAVTCTSTAMRMYQTFFGPRMLSADPGEATMAGPLVISLFRFVENVYALRGLGYVAMFFGVVMLTSQSKVFRRSFWPLLGAGLVVLGVVASLYSGGRATIVIGTMMCVVTLMLRGKRGPIAMGAISAVALIAAANLFSDWVNKEAPMQVSRTLQWVLVDKDEHASQSIEGSSDWRWNLANFAIKQWKETPKSLFFGLGFQGISSMDMAVVNFADTTFSGVSEEFAWEMAVKRVATHNMFTDLLVAYGLIGTIFYYLLLIGLMALTVHVYFALPENSPHKDFAIVVAGVIWSSATLGNIAGTFLSASCILYLIILVCALYQHRYEETSSSER